MDQMFVQRFMLRRESILLSRINTLNLLTGFQQRLYLPLFITSGLSVIWSGALVAPLQPLVDLLFISILVVMGTVWLYSFNLFRGFSRLRLRMFLLLLSMLIVAVLAIWYGALSLQRVMVLAGILLLGLIYSAPISLKQRIVRIKDMTLAKNMCIGLGWGALVLLASESKPTPALWAVFAFASCQIAVGSSVRDFFDEQLDRSIGIKSLVVVYGIERCKPWFHTWNVTTTLLAWSIFPDPGLGIAFAVAASLRGLTIHFADTDSFFWTQVVNILGMTVFLCTIYLTSI